MGMDRTERRAAVKGGIDKEDCRKNRAQQKVELRKMKRDEGLQKRRNLNLVVIDPALADDDADLDAAGSSTPEGGAAASQPPQQSFPELVQTVLQFVAANGAAEHFDAAFAATRALRKQLSLAKNPPIDDVIQAGLVPSFVTMLGHPESKLQFEASWCLTNIASGTSKQCETVVGANGVPALVGLMSSPSLDVCEQVRRLRARARGACPCADACARACRTCTPTRSLSRRSTCVRVHRRRSGRSATSPATARRCVTSC